MKKKDSKKSLFLRFAGFAIIMIILSAAAIRRDGKIWGYEMGKMAKQETQKQETAASPPPSSWWQWH